eukprot:jgi/Mesen1/3062/ME000018S02376
MNTARGMMQKRGQKPRKLRRLRDKSQQWLKEKKAGILETLVDCRVEAHARYSPVVVLESEIERRTPGALAFAEAAMLARNKYLWGGTVGPDYDCSGLMQRAFASVGVWIPRDAYQQEAFASPVAMDAVRPGDLVCLS